MWYNWNVDDMGFSIIDYYFSTHLRLTWCVYIHTANKNGKKNKLT